MAFMVKSFRQRVGGPSNPGVATLDQNIQVSRAAAVLPATTTHQLFRVRGGRVLVRQLIGEVTTATSATATNLTVSSKKLDNSSVAVGTAVAVASATAVASQEVGAFMFVEGDGTAVVLSTAGAAFVGANSGNWIAPQGEIYITTSATNTGAVKWDLFYLPLDAGAYVEAVDVATAAI